MPYKEELDAMIASVLHPMDTTRKKMFGGTCYLIDGNMICGVYRNFVILRLGQADADAALRQGHVRAFDITGRPMKGWVMIDEADLTQEELAAWIERAIRFGRSLPPT